jgi:small subunit ribosomal protein S2
LADITIKQLLEAGVHFGHQTQRWNPKMKKYIFGERNGIYIINLEITLEHIKKAQEYVRELSRRGQDILFVGTKRQAQDCIRDAADRSGMPFVNQRWLGGMLTNFDTVRKSLDRLDLIDRMEKDGSFQFIAKKEVNTLKKEREKLQKNLQGIRSMKRIPGAIFVIDAKKEEIAVKEARKLRIPVVAVLDTNCDPDLVDYAMPGNDDAIRAIRLFCDLVAEAAKEGKDAYHAHASQVKELKQDDQPIPAQEAQPEAAPEAKVEAEAEPAVAAEAAAVEAPEAKPAQAPRKEKPVRK